MKQILADLYKATLGEAPIEVNELPAHGSSRKYFRLSGSPKTLIGAINSDRTENEAFLYFSRHFRSAGLPVPEIYGENLDQGAYLEEDLGDTTLFDLLVAERQAHPDGDFPENLVEMYKRVVRMLPRFQIEGSKELDYSRCYPRHSFDRQSMAWDLNYFKYYFLKLAYIQFNEQELETDYQVFMDYLLKTPSDFFLYRDFQSRNIMIKDGEPWFIDYQGGRKGALQYDVASLLYDAKADLPAELREELLQVYLQELKKYIQVDEAEFTQQFYAFVFIRIMQAMGAYGYRGFYERKTHFLQSIPYAVRNLEYLLGRVDLPIEIPTLLDVFRQIIASSRLREYGNARLKLRVRVKSFSFKKGVPVDEHGHGGGFVFDCRFLPNPGRDVAYKQLTGNDSEVIEYFKDHPELERFLRESFSMVDSAVRSYQEQNFTDLMVSFGCTGGQHRSVYSANRLAQHLKETFDIDVLLSHRELDGD
jgi:aminoglycoside/choline kinase family phosphotransferase